MGKYKREREKSPRTIDDHNRVHEINNELKALYGKDYHGFYKSYICEMILERLPVNNKYNVRYIAHILNHTELSELPTV